MAVTIENREIIFKAQYTGIYADITFDSSYLTGGEAIAASDFGFGMIRTIIPASAEGFAVEAIESNPASWLLKGYAYSGSTNTATEFASGLNRSGVTVRCLVIGR
jgi:hypothetical protein